MSLDVHIHVSDCVADAGLCYKKRPISYRAFLQPRSGDLHSWAYPHRRIVSRWSVCENSQRKLDILPSNAAQVNIHILQRAVAGICPFTKRFENTRFLVVQLELSIASATGSICFGKETDLGFEMFARNHCVSWKKSCHDSIVYHLRINLQYFCR